MWSCPNIEKAMEKNPDRKPSAAPKEVSCQCWKLCGNSSSQVISICNALYPFGSCQYDWEGGNVGWAEHGLYIPSPRAAPRRGDWFNHKRTKFWPNRALPTFISWNKRMIIYITIFTQIVNYRERESFVSLLYTLSSHEIYDFFTDKKKTNSDNDYYIAKHHCSYIVRGPKQTGFIKEVF